MVPDSLLLASPSKILQMLSLPLPIGVSFASKEPVTIVKVFPKQEEK